MKRLAAVPIVLAISTLTLVAQGARPAENWVGTWATALVAAPAQPAAVAGRGQAPPVATPGPAVAQPTPAPPPAAPAATPAPAPAAPPVRQFNNQTLRLIVRPTVGGDRLRVVLSNQFGTAPLVVGAAHVARREKDSAINAQSG